MPGKEEKPLLILTNTLGIDKSSLGSYKTLPLSEKQKQSEKKTQVSGKSANAGSSSSWYTSNISGVSWDHFVKFLKNYQVCWGAKY